MHKTEISAVSVSLNCQIKRVLMIQLYSLFRIPLVPGWWAIGVLIRSIYFKDPIVSFRFFPIWNTQGGPTLTPILNVDVFVFILGSCTHKTRSLGRNPSCGGMCYNSRSGSRERAWIWTAPYRDLLGTEYMCKSLSKVASWVDAGSTSIRTLYPSLKGYLVVLRQLENLKKLY